MKVWFCQTSDLCYVNSRCAMAFAGNGVSFLLTMRKSQRQCEHTPATQSCGLHPTPAQKMVYVVWFDKSKRSCSPLSAINHAVQLETQPFFISFFFVLFFFTPRWLALHCTFYNVPAPPPCQSIFACAHCFVSI